VCFAPYWVAWPDLVKLVQFVLNNSPSPRINGLAPITAFTGLSSTSLLSRIVEFAEAKQTSITEIRASQILCAGALIASLCHEYEHFRHGRSLLCPSSEVARQTTICEWPNISVGDFVPVAKVSSKSGGKFCARWLGPRRVTAVDSDRLFEVEDVIYGERAIEHSARLVFYHDKSLNVTKDLVEHVWHNPSGFEIKKMNEFRKCPVSLVYEVNVSWLGFSTTETTWEPLTALHEDRPVLLTHFLAKLADQDLATTARHALF
jgi:hypothetical protein